MASLLEIGRSAINAQREALNVTGQNIVNANTEGYRRRDASLSEVSGLQSELTSLTSQTGLGVQLGEVRRSYDAFLTESKRIATGRFEASDAFVTKLERLENTILPNDGDLSVVMTTFFDALSQVAAQPGDLAPRVAAVEMGHTIGSAFNTTASLLNSQVDGTTAEIETQIVAVNSTLDALAAVNGQLRSSNLGANSPNSLLDERDRLIDSLSGKLPLSVTIGDRYDAEIRLGTSGSGPLILSGENAKTIDAVTNEKGSIEFRIGSGQIVSRLETGMLRGLVDAHGTIRRAVTELDALARDLTETMNAQHALGIDLDGQLGRELFSVVAFTAQSQASNQGSAVVSISPVPGRADQLSDMQMSFDARKGQWLLSDDSGALLDVGRARIEIDGAVINITGIPKDGDTISLNRTSGEASRMSFLLTRAEEFAAASTTTIYPDTQNSGSATITFARDVAPGSGTPSLADALSNNLSPVAAQEFLRGGVVGSIPRGTKEITLASLATQTTASVSAQVDADIISISVTVDGGVNVFSLEPSKAGRTAWKTGEEIADYLSMGVLRSESSVGSDGSEEGSKTLKELGITVSGSESGLAFASVGVQEFTSLSATSSSGVDLGTEITRGQAASDIRVFTREGRQIAGPPLQASEVAGLLTVENGFTEGAEYRSDYNTVNGSLNYRGMSVTQRMSGATALTSGLYSSEVSLAGLRGTNVDTVSETTSVNGTKGQTIKLQMATGATGSVSIPPGVDAAYVAEKANEAFAAVGVSVEAQTAVSLSLSAGSTLNSGNVQFTMSGKNQTPLTISAQINDGDMSNLVEAVNRRSSDTGVTAQLSLSGSAVTLVQADGFDLSLDNISSGDLAFEASALDQSFKPLSLDADDNTSMPFESALRFSGTVSFISGSGFTVATTATDSADSVEPSFVADVDPMIGGLVERVFDNGGTQATLSYGLDNRIDGVSRNIDGTLVHAPSSGFATELTMSDSTEFSTVFRAEVAASELANGSADGAAVAQITVKHLRADASVPSLKGAEFSYANIPPIGASARFKLAGAEYTLTRVDDGNTERLTPLDFNITGPEDGRIVPHLTETDTGYSLTLTVAGGHLSGMGPKPVSNSEAGIFGFADTDSTASVQGRSVDVAVLASRDYTISVNVNGVSETITFTKDDDGLGVPSYETGSLISVAIEEGALSSSLTLTSYETGSASILIKPSADAALLGFKVATAELSVEGGKLLVRSTNDLALDIRAGGTSVAGSYLHLTDIPDEELIVVLGDEGAKRVSAAYDIGAPIADIDREPESFRVEMMDEATGRTELFDVATGASIATRFSNGYARFNVSGQSIYLSGFAETGDNFELVTGQRSPGDSRNMDELLSFGQQKSGSRSFQDNFRSIAVGVGATLEAARLTLSSNEAVRDAAVASESELSGVNLDEEAAKLISQQQAYQAAARILQTALEMFETLIRIA
jgi:flagellar hook-associated protein 1 FlgK